MHTMIWRLRGPQVTKSPINHVFVQLFITPAKSAWPVSLWDPPILSVGQVCSVRPCQKWCGNSGAMGIVGVGMAEPGPHRLVFCTNPAAPGKQNEEKARWRTALPALPTNWLAMFTTSLVNKSEEPLADVNESPGFRQAQLGATSRILGHGGRCSGRRGLADLLTTCYVSTQAQ